MPSPVAPLMLSRKILLLFAILAFSPAAAFALDAPQLSLANPVVLPADTTTPPAARLTLYWENDGGFAKPFNSQDRHYTAGAGASLAWRAPWVDTLLSRVPSFYDEFNSTNASYAMGFVGALTIFTPETISTRQPIPDDRPYAGWTYGGLFFQRSRDLDQPTADLFGFAPLVSPAHYAAHESLELDLGMVGPSSLAQNAQEMIHHFYDYLYPRGWNNQINDEPEFSLKYTRRWRSPKILLTEYSVAADILPEVGLTAGSLIDDVRAGTLFRLGYNLPRDFGPGDLSSPADFTTPPDPHASPLSCYLFARPYGRLIAHNTLLQGDNWSNRDPITATPVPAVFATQAGLVVRLLNCLDLAYMTTWQSAEFHRQRGWDSWSSLQLSFSCTF